MKTAETIKDALAWGRRQLSASPAPMADARLLLQHVLQVEATYLIAHDDETLDDTARETYRGLVARARQHEPIPYLTGEAPFFGLTFEVSPAVLIPRPETELLVTAVIDWAREHPVNTIVDVGTGSGCIAVTLALRLEGVTIIATDVDSAALGVARANAARHNVGDRIDFRQGSLLEPLHERPNLIVANLPYVGDDEWTSVDLAVKWYEPLGALKGGADGLDLIGQLLRQARTRLQPAGAIFLEVGWQQGPAAKRLAAALFPGEKIDVRPDHAGHDRIVVIQTS